MSLANKVQYKLDKELTWIRASLKLPGDYIFDAEVIADRIAGQLRAEPERILALVVEELDADPTIKHYIERYGMTLRPEFRKYHYVILEEK